MTEFILKNDFSVRPNASEGLWTLLLLPVCILTSFVRHPIVVSNTYQLVATLSVGLLLSSLGIIHASSKNQRLRTVNIWSFCIILVIGLCFNEFFNKGWAFSIASGIFSSLIYIKLFKLFLTVFQNSFTLGEAGIVAQGTVIFIFCTIENTVRHASQNVVPRSHMQISTVILQVGIMSILLLSCTVYQLNASTVKKFYFTTVFVFLFTLVIPLQVLLKKNPIFWIFDQIITDISLLKLIIFWVFCLGLAILAVMYQVKNAQKASTSTRKIFHILAVVVYIPGLLYECSFLYLASGVILGIFMFLEMIRIVGVPPLGTQLQEGYMVFSDEKDSGVLALTPIYLLVGCSLPLWIHPAPCDITDSAMFNMLPLLSGILSIGIGDTFASIVGSNCGKIKWHKSKKTVEGTMACILSQMLVVYGLNIMGIVPIICDEELFKLVIGISIAALVEAKTDQVDNLILPLVTYIFLI